MIFLDLHKAYEYVDRSRCLEILYGCGVSPQARRLLPKYWRRLTMVARAGGYYGTAFQGVWGGDGGGIPGDPPDDSARTGSRGTMELENLGRGGRGMGISNGLPGQGRPAELPGGGMPGPSGDEDGDEGALFTAPACPRHRGHSIREEPPAHTVHMM